MCIRDSAQRVREFGMLRTLGAGRGQILASVVVEALAIGVLGALLGLLGGYAIAVGRRGVVNAALAALLGLAGLAMVVAGLFGGADGSSAAGLIGAGAVAVLLGVSLFSPRLVRPLASLAGRPLELIRKLTGRLARENTQRNPARTAVTAAALMIGLAVVAFVTVFAAGIKSSIATAVDESFQGELVMQNSDGFSPISPRAAEVARGVPGVG